MSLAVAALGGATDAEPIVATIELAAGAETRTLAAVVVHDEQGWTALCEDLEVAADGDAPLEAFQNLLRAVEAVLEIDPMDSRPRTPPADILALIESHRGPEPVQVFVFQVKTP